MDNGCIEKGVVMKGRHAGTICCPITELDDVYVHHNNYLPYCMVVDQDDIVLGQHAGPESLHFHRQKLMRARCRVFGC